MKAGPLAATVALVVAAACCASPTSVATENLAPAAATVTPDMLNPAVTQATIASTICTPRYTTSVRPTVAVTEPIKLAQIRAYGYSDTDPTHYEEDHVVPLELGGAGGSRLSHTNLFPEPHSVSYVDDDLENSLHRRVCAGSVTLAAAQASILAAKISHGYRQAVSAR